MFDPNQTVVTNFSSLLGKSNDTNSTDAEKAKGPKIPTITNPKPIKKQTRECYLEVEGNQEVFFNNGYVSHIPLQGADLLVGRRDVMAGHYPDIDLAMYRKQDLAISRRHARIYRDADNTWFVEDMCGHNATYLNNYDTPLNKERHELENGDRIVIASSIVLVFHEE